MKKKHIVFFCSLWFFLYPSCTNDEEVEYYGFDRLACNSSREFSELSINLDTEDEDSYALDSRNASSYVLTGKCGNSGSEVRVYFEGRPMDRFPVCNRGSWKAGPVDLTRMSNQKERFQVAVSQGGGVLCKNIKNYFICPENYIGVPKYEPYTYNDFCTMKYEAKHRDERSESEYRHVIVRAESSSDGMPITRVSIEDAVRFCKENGPNFDLISNDQWQSIARNIEREDANWSFNSTDVRYGNRLNTGNITSVKVGGVEDELSLEEWRQDKRSHRLSNGEYIWDFSGNLWELVKHNIRDLPDDYNGYVYHMPTSLKPLFGPEREYSILDDRPNQARDMAGLGFIRAGSFQGGVIRGGANLRTAGIFSVDTSIGRGRTDYRGNIGFRCVYYPP